MSEKFKYGRPIGKEEMLRPRRLPQYDECLREFLKSGYDTWEVNTGVLPSKNIRVVLSSLKWRTKHKPEFNGIRVLTIKNHIYLEKGKNIE